MSGASPQGWVIEEPRTSVLGGQTGQRFTFGVSPGVMAVMAGLGVVWVLGIVISGSWIVIIGGLLLLLGLGAVFSRVTDEGDGWTRTVLDRVRYRLHLGIGMPFSRRMLLEPSQLWSPAVGEVPAAIGRLREIEVPVAGGRVALLHHPKNGKSFEAGYLTGVIEVVGNGDGLRPVSEVNTYGAQFGAITRSLASAEIPVEQLDCETRVTPTDPAEYRAHVESLLVADEDWWVVGEREELRTSMRELADVGAGAGETYRSFVTVRMPLEAVAKKAYSPDGSLATVVDSATETMRKVVEKFTAADYEVRSVLTPRRLGALIRNTYVPSWSPDDLSGLETICDAFAFFGYDHGPAGRSLRVEAGPHGVWWHAVASVPMDAWPTSPVGTRWLESLVTGTSAAIIRTVKTQHQLLSVREARSKAEAAAVIDNAKLVGDAKRGKISNGVTEAQAASASRLLADLNAGAAGARPALRVLVSARSELALEDARSVVAAATEEMKIQRLSWYDRRHDLGIVPLLPMARGMKRIR